MLQRQDLTFFFGCRAILVGNLFRQGIESPTLCISLLVIIPLTVSAGLSLGAVFSPLCSRANWIQLRIEL
jgi:hypothetical protein